MPILLLEDDTDLRESLELALYGAGAGRVLSVGRLGELKAKADEALACRSAVLDVNLGPGQPTGLDAAGWLRDHGFSGRIVFLTGHAGAYPNLRRACDRPNTVLLEKPTSLTTLLSALGRNVDAPNERV